MSKQRFGSIPTEGEAFRALSVEAERRGVLTPEEAERMQTGHELRNEFAHPREQAVWTYGMAVGVLSASHQVVYSMFESRD